MRHWPEALKVEVSWKQKIEKQNTKKPPHDFGEAGMLGFSLSRTGRVPSKFLDRICRIVVI